MMKDLRFKIFDCRLKEDTGKSNIRNLKSEMCMGCESTKNSYVDNRELDDLFEKFNLANYEPIQEFHRMERIWRLYRHRRQAGHCYK
jgi:hypothetical protein